jgi:hypothetical protein
MNSRKHNKRLERSGSDFRVCDDVKFEDGLLALFDAIMDRLEDLERRLDSEGT